MYTAEEVAQFGSKGIRPTPMKARNYISRVLSTVPRTAQPHGPVTSHTLNEDNMYSWTSEIDKKQEIRSVEHGICPIAEFTCPY